MHQVEPLHESATISHARSRNSLIRPYRLKHAVSSNATSPRTRPMSTLHKAPASGNPPSASSFATPPKSPPHPVPAKAKCPPHSNLEAPGTSCTNRRSQASPPCEEGRILSLTRSYAERGLALNAPDPSRVCLSMRDSIRPSPKALPYFCSSRIRLISACTACS